VWCRGPLPPVRRLPGAVRHARNGPDSRNLAILSAADECLEFIKALTSSRRA
jgi:hypothetical protein